MCVYISTGCLCVYILIESVSFCICYRNVIGICLGSCEMHLKLEYTSSFSCRYIDIHNPAYPVSCLQPSCRSPIARPSITDTFSIKLGLSLDLVLELQKKTLYISFSRNTHIHRHISTATRGASYRYIVIVNR